MLLATLPGVSKSGAELKVIAPLELSIAKSAASVPLNEKVIVVPASASEAVTVPTVVFPSTTL